MKHLLRDRTRLGVVNVKLLFVCLVLAGVGVWYFYLREGSKGVPSLDDLRKENPFVEKQPEVPAADPVADPLGGSEVQAADDAPKNGGKQVGEPQPTLIPARPPDQGKLESTPPGSKRPSRETLLTGKWQAGWRLRGHDYAIEWDLRADGTAGAIRTQNGNQVGRFQFKWYVADDILVTEVGKSKATFRHRPINPNSFELTILSGVQVAAGQSRVLTFHRVP